MVGQSIDIHRLNLEELLGVVSIYPWYAGARLELCSRMAHAGTLSDRELSEAALYMGSRRILSELVRQNRNADYSDASVSTLLQNVMQPAEAAQEVPAQQEETPQEFARRIFVVGGDYFSKEEYKAARREGDNIFPSFATSDREDLPLETPRDDFDLCTETLAQIYAEQGYFDEARQIYSKLSLLYPEKSVYFAALIEKLDKN
ncbi:MAG: hypothetical protein J5737_04045 [Bacteroidales bacterium]|nr:hypothetical protein [Bacteroidales bacterium]